MVNFKRNRSEAQLPEDVVDKIQAVQDAAAEKMGEGDTQAGIRLFEEAWKMLPEPKLDWDYSVSLLGNLCIACIEAGKYDLARKWHGMLLKTPFSDIDSAPFELGGTIYYHLNEFDKAYEFLKLNFEVGGKFVLKLLEPDIRKFYLERAAKA